MGRSFPFLLLAGAGIGVSYAFASLTGASGNAAAAWKAGGILLLAIYALKRGAPTAAAALALSAIGDIALALEPPRWIGGMAAFGAAHLFYLAVFISNLRPAARRAVNYALACLAVAASVLLGVWFYPDMGALTAPGLAYQAIITLMVVAALIADVPVPAKAGAVAFMASDTLIALGLYKQMPPPPGSIWLSYLAAQILLAHFLPAARTSGNPRT